MKVKLVLMRFSSKTRRLTREVTTPIEYQVWSSVLGSSLTTVNASGGKVETKVFAGGTHIATQQGDGGGIVYSTADPVTGTVGQFSGSGSTALKFEESEPFGQKIELTDPGTSYPVTYQAVLGGGRDPEWQCLAAQARNSTFWDMPVHCQKSEALKSGFRFEIMIGFIESNPSRTAIGGGPPTLQKQVSNEERSLLKAIAATRKPAPWDNETDIVPESPDIPGADASQGGVDDCLRKVGLSNYKPRLLARVPGNSVRSPGGDFLSDIPYTALDLLQRVSRWEHVSPALLAVTWDGETGIGEFTGHANSNPNRSGVSSPATNWDFGPFQVNATWIAKDVEEGFYSVTDLDHDSGGRFVYGENSMSDATAPFDGLVLSNARLAARHLRHNGGNDRQRERNYTGQTNWDNGRERLFDADYPKWTMFFDCLKT